MVFHSARHRVTTTVRGFTLIELMVVSAIFVILSAVVLANHGRFGNLIVLQNLAHEIALSIRQAQVYGISVQRYGADEFDVGYGVYFTSAQPNTYFLFADAIGSNGTYDGGETVRSTQIAGGYVIDDLCVWPNGGASYTCGVTDLHILFVRPEPDALIRTVAGGPLYDRARIDVKANSGDEVSIVVERSGQISVQ